MDNGSKRKQKTTDTTTITMNNNEIVFELIKARDKFSKDTQDLSRKAQMKTLKQILRRKDVKQYVAATRTLYHANGLSQGRKEGYERGLAEGKRVTTLTPSGGPAISLH